MDEYGSRSRTGITAACNHCIWVEDVVEDTDVVFSRTKVEYLVVVGVEWPKARVIVVVVTKANGMADLDGRSVEKGT